MIILFQNIWFLKVFLVCNEYIGLFTKFKKGSGISFWCTFSVWFFHTNTPYLILYQLTKFQCHTFYPSQDIKRNVLLSSYLDNWDVINLKIYLQHPIKQWPNGGNEGKSGIQKFEFLKNEKNFLDEVKSIFHNYLRAIICWIKEK